MHSLGREFDSEQDDALTLVKWTTAVRVLATLASWLAIYIQWRIGVIQYDPRFILFALLPVYLLGNLFWYFYSVGRFGALSTHYASLVTDLLLITTALYISGQTRSGFVFLYAVAVISASVVSLQATLVFAGLSLALYALLLYMSGVGLAGLLSGPMLQHALALAVTLLVISFQSYFIISRIRRREREVSELKEEFVFRMVHDLRAPCTVIKLVIDKCNDPEFLKMPQFKDHIGLVEEANRAMLELINAILDIGRSRRPIIGGAPEVIDAEHLIASVIRDLAPMMEGKGIVISHEVIGGPHRIFADKKQIKEVLVNILDNAVKYNREEGAVRVVISKDEDYILISIKDTGVGMNNEELEKVFSPFFRAESAGYIRGTGLGLFSAKKLLELNSGRISISSILSVGTEVKIWLPTR